MMWLLTQRRLKFQNRLFAGTGGVSRGNREQGFVPGFLDQDTGVIYRSCNPDGSPAPVHRIDGLPVELVVARGEAGRVAAVKASVVAGFIRDGLFYTREQAAQAVQVP
jgi:hypothetical protein